MSARAHGLSSARNGSSSDAFLETAANARTFPDELWRERAQPSDSNSTFVHELDGAFVGMVSAFVADDPETAYLVGMWVAPELRGSGVASELVESIIEWSRTHNSAHASSCRSRATTVAPPACTRGAASSNSTSRHASPTSRIPATASMPTGCERPTR
jgi:GNAT superfamily N-acetyltransferase